MKISSLGIGNQSNFQSISQKRKLSQTVPMNHQINFKGNEKQKTPMQKVLPYALLGLGASAGIGIGMIIKNKTQAADIQKMQAALSELIKEGKTSKTINEETAQKLTSFIAQSNEKAAEAAESSKMWAAILALAGISGYNTSKMSEREQNEVVQTLTQGQSPVQSAAYGASEQINKFNNLQTNPTVSKYTADFYGISLLTAAPTVDMKQNKLDAALATITNIGHEKLTSTEPLPPIEKERPSLWSITSEFAPIKAGGLGVVPVDVRNNVVKLGVEIPTFVPMYLNNGAATLVQNGDKATYKYKKATFELDKIDSFKIDTFKNGVAQNINVELFLHESGDTDPKQQLVFIKTDKYFDGGIYEANSKTEEPEKFAVMSKAVYEFAKLKMDGPRAIKELNIPGNGAINKINAPDGLILNDWQASPVAALARYKAPMENAYGELSDETAKALRDMRIITLGHNVTYQGSTQNNNDDSQRKATTSNILNTLFDKYAFDIVRHATTKASETNPNDPGLRNLNNVLVMNVENQSQNHTNLLNMGVVLSDYFHPVSQNYANELISPEHSDLSGALQWALVQKAQAGKMVGIINGNDFNNLSIQAKAGDITKLTGLTFEQYRKTDPIEAITTARENNKVNLYQNYILPFTESKANTPEEIQRAGKINERLEFVKGAKGTELPILSREELLETPIFTSGGRLVSQKGMPVLCGAIKLLFDNWEKDFPGKNKPIFYIAGEDQEGGAQRAILENFKANTLSKEETDRVLFAHGFVPMAAMVGGCDYFLMPSMFEPCGLTQGESMALATPVIASAVGGIVDTVNRDDKTNGVLTKKEKVLTSQAFYEAMKEGIDIFFNDREKYATMVNDSLAEDFSWIQAGKKGPVFDYLDTIGVKRETLKDIC